MDTNLERISLEIIKIGRLMYERKLVSATDGNISVRLGDDKLLITKSGVCKGRMNPKDLLIITFDGKILDGKGKPSSEYRMHTLIYSERNDINAVIHAHPPLLTAFTLANINFDASWFPEVWLSIGPVATAPYATPTTEEVPQAIKPYVRNHKAILLKRHGTVTYAPTLEAAYNMLEKLEHAALTILYTKIISGNFPPPLNSRQIEQLNAILQATL